MNCFKQIGLVLVLSITLGACTSTTPTSSENAPDVPKWQKSKKHLAASYNVRLAAAYMRQGNLSRAKSKLLVAKKQAPDWPPMLDAMANYYALTNNDAEAEHFYKRAISKSNRSAESINNYGTYLCSRNHYKKAIDLFLEAAKERSYVHVAGAYENAAICYEGWGKLQLAEKYYQIALDHNPQQRNSIYAMSRLSFEQYRYKEAYARLQTFFALKGPKNPETLWLSYRISRKLGHLNEAASTAVLLKGKYPKSKEAAYVRNSQLS